MTDLATKPDAAQMLGVEEFHIRACEATPHGDASILAICNYLQEAANNHAHSLGFSITDMHVRNEFWVLCRLRVRIDRHPRWRERVRIETWPAAIDGFFANRDFLISVDGAPIGAATTTWISLDRTKRRPLRLPKELTDRTLPRKPRALPPATEEPTLPTDPQWLARFVVQWSDLDLNGHLNHVGYLRWCLDTLPTKLVSVLRPSEIDIVFRAEAHQGDRIEAHCSVESAPGYRISHHGIFRSEDGACVATATLGFTEIS